MSRPLPPLRAPSWRALAASLAIALSPLAAAGGPPLVLHLERFTERQVESDSGTTTVRVPAAEAGPGTPLIEELAARNAADEALQGVVLTLPIAPEVAYLPGTASAPTVDARQIAPEFSFDGGVTFGFEPLERDIVVIEDGAEVTRTVPVPASEYTHIRWSIPAIPAGSSVVVSFRSVVE